MTDFDWPGLGYYRQSNQQARDIGTPVDLVLMGDSLTEAWTAADPDFFRELTGRVVNRGIAGQTTPQMLLRFMADVISLRPRAVQIMGGTNDVAGNTGHFVFEDWRNNLLAMIRLARGSGLRVVLATPLPAVAFPWNPAVTDAVPRLAEMRDWLAHTAGREGLILADYYPALLGEAGAMDAAYSDDGVHPSPAGYRQLRKIAAAAFAAALN